MMFSHNLSRISHVGHIVSTSLTLGEPIYGVELDLSNKNSIRSFLVLQFKSVVRQSNTPSNTDPRSTGSVMTAPE